MRKLTLALSTAALALSGAAFAQTTPPQPRAPRPDMTRADAQARAEAMFARMDANKDGTLDEADRAATRAQMFARMDTDRDGSVSPAEFDAMHAKRGDGAGGMAMRPRDPAVSDAQKSGGKAEMFARIDTDKNGSLSRAEFEAMQGARGGAMNHAGAGGGDGAMGQPMGGGMKHGGGRGMAMDGPTTRQAFVDRALAMFDMADADRDGTVTQAERQAARDAMRQQRQAKPADGQPG